MFINSITVGSITSSVWTNATRTLTADPSTAPAADSVAVALAADTIGNKADAVLAAGTAANAVNSIACYVKSLWDLLRVVVWSRIDATISSRAPEAGGNVAAIKAKTDLIPAVPAGGYSLMQRGTITLAGVASNTATITSADQTKSEAKFLGYYPNSSTISGDHATMMTFTNATTITMTRGGTTNTVVAGYEVATRSQ